MTWAKHTESASSWMTNFSLLYYCLDMAGRSWGTRWAERGCGFPPPSIPFCFISGLSPVEVMFQGGLQ